MSSTYSQTEISPAWSPAEVPLESLPTVELTDDQLEYARKIAERRISSYDRSKNARVCGEQTHLDAHVTGAVGEVAFALHYGSPMNTIDLPQGDNGYDFSIHGHSIDTKTTAAGMTRPDLLIPAKPKPAADLYFLLHRISDWLVRIVGYASNDQVLQSKPRHFPADIKNYVLAQDELTLPPDLNRGASQQTRQYRLRS